MNPHAAPAPEQERIATFDVLRCLAVQGIRPKTADPRAAN
jgi:uncharacterized membrane protein YeiB